MKAFTLTELMVTIAIAAFIATVGYIQLSSRAKYANVEKVAQDLATDLGYARSAALFKRCPTRIIFCPDMRCASSGADSSGPFIADVSGSTGNLAASGDPVGAYAILRRSQWDTSGGAVPQSNPCPNEDAIPAAQDGFAQWDFDQKPKPIPSGVHITAMYLSTSASGTPDVSDWTVASTNIMMPSGKSLWFPTRAGTPAGLVHVPVDEATYSKLTSTGATVLVQVTDDNCDPDSSDAECSAYFVVVSNDGQFGIEKCSPGSRGTGASNICF